MSAWSLQKSLFRIAVRVSNALFGKEASHRNPFVRWMAQYRLALVETLSPARRRQRQFEEAHPDLPWLVPDSIGPIEDILRPEFLCFEWGAGRSTLWLARRVHHVISVEGRRDWLNHVARMVADAGLSDKVTLKGCDVTTEFDFDEDEVLRYAGAIGEVPDHSLDFILVDGHFRDACVNAAVGKLRAGGYLVIDNTEAMNAALIAQFPVEEQWSWDNGIWETTMVKIRKDVH